VSRRLPGAGYEIWDRQLHGGALAGLVPVPRRGQHRGKEFLARALTEFTKDPANPAGGFLGSAFPSAAQT
jgi:hypothetical protein